MNCPKKFLSDFLRQFIVFGGMNTRIIRFQYIGGDIQFTQPIHYRSLTLQYLPLLSPSFAQYTIFMYFRRCNKFGLYPHAA